MTDEIRKALLEILESLKFAGAQDERHLVHEYIVRNNIYDMYFVKAEARQKFDLEFLPELVPQADTQKEVHKITLVGKVANIKSYINWMVAKPNLEGG